MAFNLVNEAKNNLACLEILYNKSLEKKSVIELTKEEIEKLYNYKGFGGIKEILYPDDNLELWKNKSIELKKTIGEFKNLLNEYCTIAGKSYEKYISQINNSTQTAFYTPQILSNIIVQNLSSLQDTNSSGNILEPSCGHGSFITAIKNYYKPINNEITINGLEKDSLTADIARLLHNKIEISDGIKHKTYIVGTAFEKAGVKNSAYSLVLSNIPFGDIQVFDKDYFEKSKNGNPHQNYLIEFAQKSLHNYFAIKCIDVAEDNGIVAFITTGGFTNSPSNKPIRQELVRQAQLLSAIRFPDKLFKEGANTQAPSDLFIFRKFPLGQRPNNLELSSAENQFIETSLVNDIGWSKYFLENKNNVIHSDLVVGTNQYGSPTFEVKYNGSIDDIAKELNNILIKDLNYKIQIEPDPTIFNDENIINNQVQLIDNRPDVNELYDLYFKSAKKKISKISPKKAVQIIKQQTIDLFSQPKTENLNLFSAQNNTIALNTTSINKNIGAYNYKAEDIVNLTSFKEGMLYFDEYDNFYRLYKNTLTNQPNLIKIDILKYIKDNSNISLNSFDIIRLKAILNIRNAFNELFDTEFITQQEQPELRNLLNHSYDLFLKKYGVLNKPLNNKYASLDENFQFTIIGVEVPVPNLDIAKVEYTKSSIFQNPVNIFNNEFNITDEKSALIYSVNTFGHVDLEKMSDKSGIDRTQLEDKLSNYILFDPSIKSYVLKPIYLNENLYVKFQEFKDAINSNLTPQERIKYKSQLNQTERTIKENLPPIIPFDDIDVALGERWVPTYVYENFATDIFKSKVDVKYFNSNDEFKVSVIGKTYEMNTFYTANTLAGKKSSTNLLEAALLDITMVVKYTNPLTEIEEIDHKGTVICNEIIQRIRQNFVGWLSEPKNENLRQNLTDIYNYKFNGISIQKFDGSLLTFSDVNWKNLSINDAYNSQKDSLMMLLCNQGGIVDHVPGGGKSLIECMTAHYMKKMGIAKKPIIIGLKANLNDLVAVYKKAFPQDKIIAPTESDFLVSNRLKLFNQIKNNDWDCIFLTHNQFAKIPTDPNIQADMIREQLNDLELNLNSVKNKYDEISRKALKIFEKQKANLESNLEKTLAKINNKKDNLSHFGQLGIDHIIVDESHTFKNLQFTTRHNKVGGLGNIKGSQRAFNLLCAIATLQQKNGKDLQASFFSGTPISNSLTEMYLLFKYLTPNDLKKKEIINFDSWAAIYARKSSDLELSLTNQLVIKERFREFTKVPELAKDYRRITDYRSAEDIGLKRPPIKEELIIAKPTNQQMEIFLDMQDFMKTGKSKFFDFSCDSDNLIKAKGLIAANICGKTCLDVRFVLPDQDYEKGSKVDLLLNKVYEFYTEPNYSKDKATQLIFLDSGVPNGQSFNLYQDIKNKLIEKGIKANEIAFIHDYNNQNVKPILIQKMKEGSIRVLIGGTEKLGTGWNLQHRIIAMHNLDIPWKPSEFDQRKGRGHRSGNWLAEKYGGVYNFYYVTENSPEVAKVDRVKMKATFINQIKNGTISVRKIDEGLMDEDTGLSYADIVMQTSGDSRYKLQNKLENIISKMEIEKSLFISIALNNKHKLKTFEKTIPYYKKNIDSLQKDLIEYNSNKKFIEKGENKGEIFNETKIFNKQFSSEEQLGKYLISISQNPMKENEKEIGSLYGFHIKMKQNLIAFDNMTNNCNTFEIYKNGKEITYNGGLISNENPKRAARHFYYALNRIEALIEREKNSLNLAEKEYSKINNSINIEYPKEKELVEYKVQLNKLTNDIKNTMQQKNDNTDSIKDISIVRENIKNIKPNL